MEHGMYAVRRLSVLGLAVVLASAGFAEDPVTKDDTAKDEPKADELVEPEAKSTWEFLADKYDADEDGKITPEEYGRDETHFKRLDIDSDGFIAKAEIDERDRSARSERGGRGGGRFGGGRGGRGGGGRRGPRGDGEERTARAAAPLEGSEAPDFDLLVLSEKADAKAEAEDADEERAEEVTEEKGEDEEAEEEKKLKLSSFEKDRPVALIFGSYT